MFSDRGTLFPVLPVTFWPGRPVLKFFFPPRGIFRRSKDMQHHAAVTVLCPLQGKLHWIPWAPMPWIYPNNHFQLSKSSGSNFSDHHSNNSDDEGSAATSPASDIPDTPWTWPAAAAGRPESAAGDLTLQCVYRRGPGRGNRKQTRRPLTRIGCI